MKRRAPRGSAARGERQPGEERTSGDHGVLDPKSAALVRVAAGIALGSSPELTARLARARSAGVPGRWIEELLLQSLLVVGYPLTLVAFAAWRELTGPLPSSGSDGPGEGEGEGEGDDAEALAHADWKAWAERGSAVCRAVYGRAYHKLLINLRALHPALEDLVLVDAYGKVIGRPGLDLKRRELSTVAAIAVLGTAQQLHSHLRGALNTGATPDEVEAVLALIEADLEPAHRQIAREQWQDVKGRNLKA
jgi:4-carboxymuconolactone decarboxylase